VIQPKEHGTSEYSQEYLRLRHAGGRPYAHLHIMGAPQGSASVAAHWEFLAALFLCGNWIY
jgi:hypothetical protein